MSAYSLKMEIYIGWERIFGGIYIDGETPLLIEVGLMSQKENLCNTWRKSK